MNELFDIIDANDHLYDQQYFTVLEKELIDGGVFKAFTYKDSLRFTVLFRISPSAETINLIADKIAQYKNDAALLWYSQINGFSNDLLDRLGNYIDSYHFFCYKIKRDDISTDVDMKGLICRKCTADMIDTCIDIMEDVFTPYPDSPGSFINDKERITADFLDGTSLFFKDNELVGFCGHKDGHITETVVRKEFQGQGYGEIIVRAVLKSIYESGYDAELTTNYDNKRAIALYEKVGFRKMYESIRVTLRK